MIIESSVFYDNFSKCLI